MSIEAVSLAPPTAAQASQRLSFPARRLLVSGIVASLLTLAFGLMLTSAVRKSSTVDEQTHLFRGTAYLRERATQFQDVHPPTSFALQALPLLTEPTLRLPLDNPAWNDGRWEIAANAFLWQINDSPLRLIFLGRLSTMWLTLLLGALVFRWGRQLGGPVAATVALVLVLFDPNVLAHGRLFTNDISVTFYMILATYSYWHWAKTERWGAVGWLGLGLGLAGATKYSAITLVPALLLISLWLVWRRRSWRPLLALGAGGLLALMVIWALYGFVLRPVPLAPLWADLAWTLDYFGQPSGAYLLGETRPGGWWYYFPVAYLVKTPLATLILVIWAAALTVVAVARRRLPSGMDWLSWAFLSVPPAMYLAVSLVGPLNIGYRHLLPVLPYGALFVGVSLLSHSVPMGIWPRRLAMVLVASVVVLSLISWPDYISYFNRLAGGPDVRWRVLSDSNIDWGQDLPGLVDWNNARRDDRPLYVSYFGTAKPQAYGLDYLPIPTWAPGPEQLPPDRQSFDPDDPAPGWYALSVTNLHGHVLANPELYAAFRDQVPAARIGDSIRIYDVGADGPPFDLALFGLTPADLNDDLHAMLPGNDRRLRWLVDGDGLVWSGEGLWLAMTQPIAAELQPYLRSSLAFEAGGQMLYRLDVPHDPDWATGSDTFGEALTLLGSKTLDLGGDEIGVLTYWEVVAATDRPLKLFVHALDANGTLVSQWDGLSIDPAGLQPGDRLLQFHRLPAPSATVERLVTGVYDGETLSRLMLLDGRDSIDIGE